MKAIRIRNGGQTIRLMNTLLPWQKDVLLTLNEYSPQVIQSDVYTLVSLHGNMLMLNLIPLINKFIPEELVRLQQDHHNNGVQLIHLWEDIWHTRRVQVIGKIRSALGLNTRIHGRKTKIVALTQPQADAFLLDNHLQASARSRYKLALILNDTVMAVACFSNLRIMQKIAPGYRSAELVRFATAIGFTVTGGFSKLLKHFIAQHRPDDIMSYADRDWSVGNAYQQSGFELIDVTPPAEIMVDQDGLHRYFPHRAPQDGSYIKIFNTGNLKYIYKVS